MSEQKKYLDLDGLQRFWSKIKERLDAINSYLDFLKSSGTVTSLSNLNINKRLYVANVTTKQTISLSGKPAAGRDMHIIIKNQSNNPIDITMPTHSYCDLICDPVYSVDPGKYLEVNIISDGSIAYVRAAGQN